MPPDSPFAAAADGVTVAVKVTPRASRERVLGVQNLADGSAVLAVAVTAVPEDGKANAAVIRLLAKEWRGARSAIRLVAGAAARRKRLHLDAEPVRALETLAKWARDLT
ncbi:MAG: DUF167 domain-containing protein [Inquilinus sp.]|nr:DUF167 domain-containing protein [Inquilinus sp.]